MTAKTVANALVRVTLLAFISSVAATMGLCGLYVLSRMGTPPAVTDGLARHPLLKWAWYASGLAIGLVLVLWALAMVGLVQ